MAILELAHATVRYGSHVALREVSFALADGERVALIGPNGSGKTTLLRALAGIEGVASGSARPVAGMARRDVARLLAYVPQEEFWEFAFPVSEVVACGRYAHVDALFGDSAADREAVDEALAAVDMTALRDRPVNAISGGERRRAILARALAQRAAALVLDEPTTALDLGHREAVLRAVSAYRGAVLFATHDLDAAAAIAGRIVVLAAGRIVKQGSPREVLTESLLYEVFDVRARVIEEGGRLHVLL
jgi:iron complex transport system ATP-binding protein